MQHYIIDRPKGNGVKTYASTSKSSTGSFSREVKYSADSEIWIFFEVRIADCAIKRKIWKRISDGFQ